MNVRFWPILLKKSASVSTAEKYASEIEIRVLRRRFSSGLRFDVATCKKGVFTDQCMGSLAGSTFSTQSADCCLSSPSASASCSSQARGRPTLVLGPIASKPRIGSTGTGNALKPSGLAYDFLRILRPPQEGEYVFLRDESAHCASIPSPV